VGYNDNYSPGRRYFGRELQEHAVVLLRDVEANEEEEFKPNLELDKEANNLLERAEN
jgi:hypothetical protein